MKSIIKNNWLMVIILLITAAIIIFASIDEIKTIESNEKYLNEAIKKCEKEEELRENDTSYDNMCNQFINNKNVKVDFFTAFTDVLVWKIHFLNPLAFLIIIIPSLYNICKILRNKSIINSLTRQSYKKFMKSYLKKAYKYNWVLPFLMLIIIIILAKKTTFNPTYAINNATVVWDKQLISSPVKFIFLYLLNIIMYSFTFINIALVVAKKQQKFIPCVILSYLSYIGIELFFEIGITMILFNIILKSDLGILFNIVNIFMFNDTYGTGSLLLFSLIIMIISFFLLYITYKDKEKLVISCEKNN